MMLWMTLAMQTHAEGLDYKKFGRIATAVVTEDYPSNQVVDYKYQGRQKADANKVIDSFRFKVMISGKEQFVTVKITHDNQAGKELTITLIEEKQ